MIKLVPFEPSHVLAMSRRPEEKENANYPGYPEMIKKMSAAGNCYSIGDGDDIVSCGGISALWPGVGEAWVICSSGIWRYARQLLTISRSLIEKIECENNLVRVQAHVKASWPAAISFVERLGFEREGLLRKYMNGEDYLCYARLRHG
jgi:hypothetical protein